MKFEGSEKKLEIITSSQSQSLRSYGDSFYKSLVKKTNAQIVGQSFNNFIQSYILSESSLFVWDHRLILITCGQTTLVKAVPHLLKRIKKTDIEACFFQRKNEFFPLKQKTTFDEDIRQINKQFQGSSYRFGNLDEHHFFLFHLDQEFSPSPKDQTVEILMYGLMGDLTDVFNHPKSIDHIRKTLNLESCFPQFTLHDHLFKPRGYSLNALNGNDYYTIHVTPQDVGFYVSFETNMADSVSSIVEKVTLLFRPTSFDIITFLPWSKKLKDPFEIPNYFKISFSQKMLQCGFNVEFLSFKNIQNKKQSVYKLD